MGPPSQPAPQSLVVGGAATAALPTGLDRGRQSQALPVRAALGSALTIVPLRGRLWVAPCGPSPYELQYKNLYFIYFKTQQNKFEYKIYGFYTSAIRISI